MLALQLMKNETLKIMYSYWDGQGHRRVATVKKGDTVKDFLQKVKEQLIPEFRELRYAWGPASCVDTSRMPIFPRALIAIFQILRPSPLIAACVPVLDSDRTPVLLRKGLCIPVISRAS